MPISRDRIRHTGPAPSPVLSPAPHSPAPPKAPGRPVAAAGKPGKGEVVPTADKGTDGVQTRTITQATVTATCGHEVTFNLNKDKTAADRIAKHRDRKCGKCRDAESRAKQIAASKKIPKNLDPNLDAKERAYAAKRYAKRSPYPWGEPGHLPKDAVFTLRYKDGSDDVWIGEVTAGGLTVRTEGIGPARQIPWLAGSWLVAKYIGSADTGTPPPTADQSPPASPDE